MLNIIKGDMMNKKFIRGRKWESKKAIDKQNERIKKHEEWFKEDDPYFDEEN